MTGRGSRESKRLRASRRCHTAAGYFSWRSSGFVGPPRSRISFYGTYPNSSNLVFTSNSTLSSNLANISFYSDSGTTSIGSGFERGFTGGGTEIIAVPETETYFYAVDLLAGIVIRYLRRRAKRKPLGGSSSRIRDSRHRTPARSFAMVGKPRRRGPTHAAKPPLHKDKTPLHG